MTNQANVGPASIQPRVKAVSAVVQPSTVISTPGMDNKATVLPTSKHPPAAAGAASLAPPKIVSTGTGTLAITLTPPPPAPVPLLGNVVFWVSIISFIGVAASLWQAHRRMTRELHASDERLRTELKASAEEATIERNQSREQANLDRQHDADQAHQERITKARRDVYLELISEMTKAQFTLSMLPAQNIERLDIQTGFGGLINATSKISILGEMETVALSRELLNVIHEALFRVLPLLGPLQQHKNEGNAQEKKFDAQNSEIDRLSAEIQSVLEGNNDTLRLRGLKRAMEFRLADADKAHQAGFAAELSHQAALQRYNEAVMAETKIVNRKVNQLILAIRTELALTTSLELLQSTSDQMHASAVGSLARLRETLKPAVEPTPAEN